MVNYYIKKTHEEKLTNLGTYNDIINLKENILIYFDDCQKLITRIEQEEFKIKDGLLPMIKFYNKTCSN